MGGREHGGGHGRVGRCRPAHAPLAALVAASLAFSACATAGTPTAAPEGEAPPPAAAQAAQPEGEKPAGETPTGAKPAPAKPAGAKGATAKAAEPPPRVGLLSPLATVGYFPLKLLPCSLGAVGSILGFFFTFDAQMVRETLTLNCGGDWVITPGMLEGKEGFRPVGRTEAVPPPPPPPAPQPSAIAPPLREPSLNE